MNNFILLVAIKEDFYEILYAIHCFQTHHSGQIKTFDAVYMRYRNMPKRIVVAFIHVCPPCNLKQIQQSQPRLNPIRSECPLQRFQIDLIDMRHLYRYANLYMRAKISTWDGNCKTVHGRPRYPQSQGLVQQANGTLEVKLAAMMS